MTKIVHLEGGLYPMLLTIDRCCGQKFLFLTEKVGDLMTTSLWRREKGEEPWRRSQ